MNASLFDRARAERFAQLLDEAAGGRRHHARSHLDDQLVTLVATSQKLSDMPVSVAPDATFKRDLRAMLIATAERDGIGVTSMPEKRASLRRVLANPRAGKPRRGAIIIGIAAGTLALSGVSVASGEANPGDALYGMKRQTEKAQLALAGSEMSRGQLYLDFARTRLHEAHASRSNEGVFINALADMDTETQLGVRALIGVAIGRNDTTALDAIDGFVERQRMLIAPMLELAPPNGRAKVTSSLALLTKVQERATATRTALACGAKPAGSDPLGPVLGACTITTQNRTQGSPSQQNGQTTTPGQTGAGTTAAAQPGGAPATATPSAAPESESGGLLGELGRILGGLLGG